MKAKTSLAIGLLTVAPATFWMVACSSDTPSGTDGGDIDASVMDTGTGTDTGTGMDTGVDTGSGMDSGGGGNNCLDAGNGNACRACCRNAHMQGVQALVAAERMCICTGNKCPSCAGNFCDGGNPNNQCDNCGTATLSPDGGACFAPVTQACNNSPDCVALRQCLNSCP